MNNKNNDFTPMMKIEFVLRKYNENMEEKYSDEIKSNPYKIMLDTVKGKYPEFDDITQFLKSIEKIKGERFEELQKKFSKEELNSIADEFEKLIIKETR